jgi:hypothetical protein
MHHFLCTRVVLFGMATQLSSGGNVVNIYYILHCAFLITGYDNRVLHPAFYGDVRGKCDRQAEVELSLA